MRDTGSPRDVAGVRCGSPLPPFQAHQRKALDYPRPTAPPPPGGGDRTGDARSLADGRYILVRKIAEGGTAMVHLGFDTWTDQWRAVKTLLPEYAQRPALRHRFEREAATMKGLSHENIIAVYDAGVDGDVAYMVMEFAEGGSVIDWVERYGPMPPRLATEVTLHLCDGIDAAHRQGIIHRDVKPQNLLVDRHGRCKVTDFGIAQVMEETRMTMTGTVMGTIGYMAPEQHESAKHADERADIYSIAATFYTLLKGEAATHLFMAESHDFEGLPEPLAAVIRKGAEYRREARYGTVGDMIEALHGAMKVLGPDPLDTPPLVSHDLPLLDDITPPSFATVRPRAEHHAIVPAESPSASTDPQPLELQSEPSYTPDRLSREDLTEGGRERMLRSYQDPPARPSDRAANRRAFVLAAAVVSSVSFLCTLAIVLNALVYEQLYVSRRNRAMEHMATEFFDQLNGRVNSSMERFDDLEGREEAQRLIGEFNEAYERARRGSEEVVELGIRIEKLLDQRVRRDLCDRAESSASMGPCRDMGNAIETLEKALQEVQSAERELAKRRDRWDHQVAGCVVPLE